MVLIGQKWLYSGKVVVIRTTDCVLAKVVLFGESGCIWAKMVVIGQKWLYLGKVVVFEQK